MWNDHDLMSNRKFCVGNVYFQKTICILCLIYLHCPNMSNSTGTMHADIHAATYKSTVFTFWSRHFNYFYTNVYLKCKYINLCLKTSLTCLKGHPILSVNWIKRRRKEFLTWLVSKIQCHVQFWFIPTTIYWQLLLPTRPFSSFIIKSCWSQQLQVNNLRY